MITPDMDHSDNAFKQLPYYKAIAKSLIRKQIQYLLEELSDQTGEESIILTANVNSGTLSHQGSSTAKGFLDNRDDIKTEFLSYIISSNIERAQKEFLKETRPPKPKKPVSDGPMHGQAQLMPTMLPREPMMPRESTIGAPQDDEVRVTGVSEGSVEKEGGQDGEKESLEQGTPGQFSSQGSPDDSNSNFADGKEVLVKMEPKGETEGEMEFDGGPGVEYSGGSMYLSQPWAQENSGFGPTSSAMSMMTRTPPSIKEKRASLSLHERVCVIQDFSSAKNVSHRLLANKYKCSRSTIRDILAKRELYLTQYEFNAKSTRKRFKMSCKFSEVNDKVYQWYCEMLLVNAKLSGPVIRDKALEFAHELGILDFKASNGWLHSWKIRYNLLQTPSKPSAESGASEASSETSNFTGAGLDTSRGASQNNGGFDTSISQIIESCMEQFDDKAKEEQSEDSQNDTFASKQVSEQEPEPEDNDESSSLATPLASGSAPEQNDGPGSFDSQPVQEENDENSSFGHQPVQGQTDEARSFDPRTVQEQNDESSSFDPRMVQDQNNESSSFDPHTVQDKGERSSSVGHGQIPGQNDGSRSFAPHQVQRQSEGSSSYSPRPVHKTDVSSPYSSHPVQGQSDGSSSYSPRPVQRQSEGPSSFSPRPHPGHSDGTSSYDPRMMLGQNDRSNSYGARPVPGHDGSSPYGMYLGMSDGSSPYGPRPVLGQYDRSSFYGHGMVPGQNDGSHVYGQRPVPGHNEGPGSYDPRMIPGPGLGPIPKDSMESISPENQQHQMY